MANNNQDIIDTTYTEVHDGDQDTTKKIEATQDTTETKKGFWGSVRSGIKKYGIPVGGALLFAGVATYAYKKAGRSIPDSIKDGATNGKKLYTVITGSVPKDQLNSDELDKWNNAVNDLEEVMTEAKTRIAEETSES